MLVYVHPWVYLPGGEKRDNEACYTSVLVRKRGITRRVCTSVFGRIREREAQRGASYLPSLDEKVRDSEARLFLRLWEKQGGRRDNEARLIVRLCVMF